MGPLLLRRGELTLSAPPSNAGHCRNLSPWRRDACLRPQNLRQLVVAVPRAECVAPWYLDGGSRGRNGVGDGCSSGDGDVRGRMAEGMRAGAQAERADAVDARLWILHNDDNKSIIQSPKGA